MCRTSKMRSVTRTNQVLVCERIGRQAACKQDTSHHGQPSNTGTGFVQAGLENVYSRGLRGRAKVDRTVDDVQSDAFRAAQPSVVGLLRMSARVGDKEREVEPNACGTAIRKVGHAFVALWAVRRVAARGDLRRGSDLDIVKQASVVITVNVVVGVQLEDPPTLDPPPHYLCDNSSRNCRLGCVGAGLVLKQPTVTIS
jgi:hypothetical protein